MMPRTLAGVLGVLLLAQPVGAAIQSVSRETGKKYFWSNRCVSLDLFIGDPPSFATSNSIVLAATKAATAWNPEQSGCGDIILRVSSNPGGGYIVDFDRRNTVQFRKDYWGRNHPDPQYRVAHDPSAFALTTVTTINESGEIVDTDVEINAVKFKWDDLVTNSRPGEIVADLQNTLTHEFGHVIGLDHNCNDAGMSLVDVSGARAPSCSGAVPASIRDATMYPRVDRSDILRRDLGADDLAGLCAIYPRTQIADRTSDINANGNRVCNGYVPGPPDGEGGCAMSHPTHKSPLFGFGLLAGLFAARCVCTRRRR